MNKLANQCIIANYIKPSLQETLGGLAIKSNLKWWDCSSINPSSLYDNNFRVFTDNFKKSQFGMQKRYDDEFGKKYFITFYFYYSENINPNTPYYFKGSWSAQSQFVMLNDATTDISLNSSAGIDSVKDVEAYFEELFQKMGFAYYEPDYALNGEEINKKQLLKKEAASLAVHIMAEKIEIEKSLEPDTSKLAILSNVNKKNNKIKKNEKSKMLNKI